jgi:2-C-methyl-D-erythritol 4-phosphate cytidylyltransferase / 2-C-methyl-D-erythritol 2,4-cyclodiphosphate synthase
LTDISLIILCAGESSRFSMQAKKQWLRCENEPLWLLVANNYDSFYSFKDIIIVSHKDELNYMKNFSDKYIFVTGGSTRQESLKNGLQKVTSQKVMITDVARSCVPKNMILDIIESNKEADCIVPYLNASDTVVYKNDTINRDDVKLIQTPQLSTTSVLQEALTSKEEFTDDSSAIKANGGTIKYILGSNEAKKLTFGDEIKEISCLKPPSSDQFNGTGFDIHPFENGKQMVLGGIKLDVPYGFKAHSDGDVLIHSLIDALLGACGAGDIGEFFPDTDDKYKNIDSQILLENIVKFIKNVGYEIINVDITIIAQKPKIGTYKNEIKHNIAKILNLTPYMVNIKATTAEKLGFVGRGEGVAVQSSATLKYFDWTKGK